MCNGAEEWQKKEKKNKTTEEEKNRLLQDTNNTNVEATRYVKEYNNRTSGIVITFFILSLIQNLKHQRRKKTCQSRAQKTRKKYIRIMQFRFKFLFSYLLVLVLVSAFDGYMFISQLEPDIITVSIVLGFDSPLFRFLSFFHHFFTISFFFSAFSGAFLLPLLLNLFLTRLSFAADFLNSIMIE